MNKDSKISHTTPPSYIKSKKLSKKGGIMTKHTVIISFVFFIVSNTIFSIEKKGEIEEKVDIISELYESLFRSESLLSLTSESLESNLNQANNQSFRNHKKIMKRFNSKVMTLVENLFACEFSEERDQLINIILETQGFIVANQEYNKLDTRVFSSESEMILKINEIILNKYQEKINQIKKTITQITFETKSLQVTKFL